MSSEYKTLNTTSLPIESAKLYCPPLQEIAKVLSDGLPSIFEKVSVEVCDCPNLEQPPFHLASEGINGKTSLIDIGGPPYLLPLVKKEKVYTFEKLNEICGNTEPAFFIGAGAGPFPYAGINCEMIANLKISGKDKTVKTHIAKIVNEEKGEFKLEMLPNDETRFALLGNFFLSEGKPGKVVKINCRKRVGSENFITAIQKVLKNKYGSQPIGMGGVFLLTSGKAKQHIMPSFSQKPLTSEDDLNKWLRFFEMHSPLVAVGTLVTEDPGLDLRLTHFHSFNNTSGEGGHYHYDTTPDVVEYEAYFTTAEYVYRVDKPVDTHQVGRD